MDYVTHVLIIIGIYSILAMSLNLVVGYTGLLSVAHAAFFGIGSYSTAILTTRYDFTFLLSLFAGALFSLMVSCIFGYVLSRFKENYYVLISFSLNVVVYGLFMNLEPITRGSSGIFGIPRPYFFNDNQSFLILVLLFVLVFYLFFLYIRKTSFTRTLISIREDEDCSSVLGFNVFKYKLLAFMISGSIAAIAGSLYASYISFIDPNMFNINESIFILSILILGGLASKNGPILGVFFFVFILEALRFLSLPAEIAGQLRSLVYGLSMVGVIMFFPRGFLGKYKI